MSQFVVISFILVSSAAHAVTLSSSPTTIKITSSSVPGTGWTQIANTKLQTLCPPNNFGGTNYAFSTNCRGVVTAWSSAFMDTKRNRLLVWGGGHNDYYGNEIYAVNLTSKTIQRLNDPGLPLAPMDGSYGPPAIAGGTQPNSRHTYDGLAYMENVDKLFVIGGAYAGVNGAFGSDIWTFDLVTMRWERKTPSGPTPRPVPGLVTAYDPNSGKVFIHDDHYLYRYDPMTNVIAQVSGDNAMTYTMTAVIDPVRKRMLIVGSGSVYSYDISSASGPYTRQTLSTSGGNPIVSSGYPGLAYSDEAAAIVAWNGGDAAYVFNFDSATWTAKSFPGGPGSAQQTGTYKRFSYSKALKAFVLVNDMQQNAYLLKTP